VKKIIWAALLAVSMVACGPSEADLGDPVQLVTGMHGPANSCFTNWAEGKLVRDATYGTVIQVAGHDIPVMWRLGFTGWVSGSEIVVVDASGSVVATTGRRYRIDGGYVGADPTMFWACDQVRGL
jgi:hypothetical protein